MGSSDLDLFVVKTFHRGQMPPVRSRGRRSTPPPPRFVGLSPPSRNSLADIPDHGTVTELYNGSYPSEQVICTNAQKPLPRAFLVYSNYPPYNDWRLQ